MSETGTTWPPEGVEPKLRDSSGTGDHIDVFDAATGATLLTLVGMPGVDVAAFVQRYLGDLEMAEPPAPQPPDTAGEGQP